MLRNTLISILAARFGDRTDLVDTALPEMDFVQTFELEENDWLPWFLLQVNRTDLVIIGVGNSQIILPDDFLAADEDEILEYRNAEGVWLEVPRGTPARLKALQLESGPPKAYALRGTILDLTPAPDAVYDLRWTFYARDALPSTSEENLWMKHAADVLIAATGKRIAVQLSDNERLAIFENDLTAAWNRLYTKHIMRMEQNRVRVMGDE